MKPRPRLVVATSTFPRSPDDAEPDFVWALAQGLSERFEVTVVCPHGPELSESETWGPVRIRRFRYAPLKLEQLAYVHGMLPALRARPWRLLLLPGFMLGFAWALRCEMSATTPTVLHAHWVIPGGFAACLSGRLRRSDKRVCTVHGGDVFGLGGPWVDRLMGRILRRFDKVTAVSPAVARRVAALGVDSARVVTVPMGVSRIFDAPVDNTDRRVARAAFVGRLVEKKGAHVLLDALARLRATQHALSVDIIGGGAQASVLKGQAHRLGLTRPMLRFLGAQPTEQVAAALRGAQIFVFPSLADAHGDAEGLGLTALEAALAGCVVVASALPANAHVWTHDETAILVPPGQPEALADALRAVLMDAQRVARIARAGQAMVRSRFGWPRLVAAHADVLGLP